MSLSNTTENALLALIFQNANFANIGDATGLRGSSTAGSFYLALYTADPGEAGSATTNEATYTSYGRIALARSAVDFTVTGNQVVNANGITFATCTGGSNTITHWGIVTSSSGAGTLLWSGSFNSAIAVSNNIAPFIASGALQLNID